MSCGWCGTGSGTGSCFPYSSGSMTCSSYSGSWASSPSSCPSSGGGGVSAFSATYSGFDAAARSSTSSGIAVSVIAAVVFTLLLIARTKVWPTAGAGPASPLASQWAARAAQGSDTLVIAFGFSCLAISTAIAALGIPWWSGSVSGSYSDSNSSGSGSIYATASTILFTIKTCYAASNGTASVSDCQSVAIVNYIMIAGAIIALFGLIVFILPACILSGVGSVRLMRVHKFSQMPDTASCCCRPSLPCIQGLLWFGFFVCSVGFFYLWTIYVILNSILGPLTSFQAAGAGLLAFAYVALFCAAVSSSVAGGCCCGTCGQVGNLPGVGRARSNCCCPELDSSLPENPAFSSIPPTMPPAMPPPGFEAPPGFAAAPGYATAAAPIVFGSKGFKAPPVV